MTLPIDLRGRVAIVTGASGGIGLGVARMLARAGAHISGCSRTDRDHADVRALTETVEEAGADCLYTPADVTDPAHLRRVVDRTMETYGRIDIVVSNAGQNLFFGAAGCDDEQWERNMALNLRSHWQLARRCRPHLEVSNGTIIIMTSNHAYASIPGCFPYNVAKTALTGLVRSLAIEWGPRIRTVGLAPGFIDTPGNDAWFASFPDPLQEREKTKRLHPVGRLGTADEVGAFCAFLASPFAAFATGSTYVLDGGRTALLQDF